LNEAVACVREGIVADADLCDAGVIFGTGFAPHRGGPINAIRERGKEAWIKIMAGLEAQHGERFKPDAGWASL
jgi:3-hydroxyacyl-CoA dehydrogenase/enoyl-CoA hydratase/3-hydroxybutyryl-CoA epimerase